MFLRWIVPLSSKPSRLYILDSSFNPPTNAHLSIISNCPGQTCLLLSTNNVDKASLELENRIELVKLLGIPFAITDAARFVDKAKLFDYPTTFCMGFDTLERFFDFKYYDDFEMDMQSYFSNSRIIVTDRGSHSVNVWERDELKVGLKWKSLIDASEPLKGIALSSTMVRQWVASADISKLKANMPEKVLQMILDKKMYIK